MAEQNQNSVQVDILGNIYNNIRKGLAMGKDLIMLQGSARCFAPGTKVRMYDGSLKNIEDIEYFDKIANIDGNGYNLVVNKHNGKDLMYRVSYNDGSSYVVNSQHELVLIGKYDAEYHIPVDKYVELIATEDWAKSLKGCSIFNGVKHKRDIIVKEIGFGEYYGFTLTGDHLFLLEDGTIVKNSGKTYNTLIYIILECLQNPIRERKVKDPVSGKILTKKEPLRVSIVRNSLPVIKRSVYEDFKTIMINMGQWEDKRMNRTDYIYTFQNGATIEFFSAEDEQKLRGPWRHILYINEANEIYYYSFSMLRQRTYEYTIVDYNPSFTEEHWLFPLMKDERSYHFISTYKDNIFLPAPAIREIESYQTTNPALWQIFGKGEFAIVEGLVFPKENWDIIEDDAYPTWLGEEYIGIDWGFAQDPTVFVGVIINGGDVYVRELLYKTGMKTKDIAEALEPYAGNYKYCDIDGRLVSELEDAGIPLLTMTKKNSESIMSGIRLMNQRKIHITSSSNDIIKEFRNYVYKKDRYDTYQTNLKPIDKFNHTVDSIRYVILAECGGINGEQNQDMYLSKEDLGIFM